MTNTTPFAARPGGVAAANLGYPRIGPDRELKRALEAHWRGDLPEAGLLDAARALRQRNWQRQATRGITWIPSGDFSLYDHVLDTAALVGAVPPRFGWSGGEVDPGTYFAMARGGRRDGVGNPEAGPTALEMTKWFDTNYHYLVPEFEPDQPFRLTSTAPVDHFLEARDLGIHTRPVVLGPVSFLSLGKMSSGAGRPIDLLDRLIPVYTELLGALRDAGADWIQIDEPWLARDLDIETRDAFARAYDALAVPGIRLLLTSYFGGLGDNLELATSLPVAGVHLDLVAGGAAELDSALDALSDGSTLSLGVVNGRNVWRTDLDAALALVRRAVDRLGAERVIVSPSCSLLHVPVDLDAETAIDDEARGWLAFADQKLEELSALAAAAGQGTSDDAGGTGPIFAASRRAVESRRISPRTRVAAVRERVLAVTPEMERRPSPFLTRKRAQEARLGLPPLPTTTIGSFPQTAETRRARAAFQAGRLPAAEYDAIIAREIDEVVRFQEEIGLDVLVHGEPERSDMVEYFGERLEGFLFTRNGWVQSYGSRCIRPPVIFGDVSRPAPMTVEWSRYARSRTERPMKGMLTGPVTILQWSFVRDDQPRSETCRQIALALRDEVADLEAAGLPVIQIDEPALREGLPLRASDQHKYLDWAVRCFRLASSGVADGTQIHTHMCYAEFNEIMDAIVAMDADVISIESSRSGMEPLDALHGRYPNDVGPGVYDIHSPRVPPREEVRGLIERALAAIPADRLWVNPDCGLKTRRWEEVRPALQAMVEAAQEVRGIVNSEG